MLPANHEHDNGYENDERDDVFAHNLEWRKTGAFDKGVGNVLPDEDTGKKNPGNSWPAANSISAPYFLSQYSGVLPNDRCRQHVSGEEMPVYPFRKP